MWMPLKSCFDTLSLVSNYIRLHMPIDSRSDYERLAMLTVSCINRVWGYHVPIPGSQSPYACTTGGPSLSKDTTQVHTTGRGGETSIAHHSSRNPELLNELVVTTEKPVFVQ